MSQVLAWFAPAKINLDLRIVGRRADGYHLLDSLVAFADVGDMLTAATAETLSLTVTGPFGASLADTAGRGRDDNLVLQAARLLVRERGVARGARLALDKQVPVASGIGGGSSDAAAALLLLGRLWGVDARLPDDLLARELGADVPVCLRRRPTLMTGIGEVLRDAPHLPPCAIVLANPGVPLATARVFAAFAGTPVSTPPARGLRPLASAADLAAELSRSANDLTAAATATLPVIAEVLAALNDLPGCLLARLSGSGPTCFALFAAPEAAHAAAAVLAARQPSWWVRAAQLGDFSDGEQDTTA
jgi:4-diphosphocytidyl-2-C-methyl-D-erythritol kinase